jgi:hypothetical protein
MNKISLWLFYLSINFYYFSILSNDDKEIFKENKNDNSFYFEDENIKKYCINLIITIIDSIVKNDLNLNDKEVIKNTILKDSVFMNNLVKFINKKIKLQKELNYKSIKTKENKFYKNLSLFFFALIFSIDEFYKKIIKNKYSYKIQYLKYLPYSKIISGLVLSFFSFRDLINEKDYQKMLLQLNSKEEIEEENQMNDKIIEKIINEGELIIAQKDKNKNNYL